MSAIPHSAQQLCICTPRLIAVEDLLPHAQCGPVAHLKLLCQALRGDSSSRVENEWDGAEPSRQGQVRPLQECPRRRVHVSPAVATCESSSPAHHVELAHCAAFGAYNSGAFPPAKLSPNPLQAVEVGRIGDASCVWSSEKRCIDHSEHLLLGSLRKRHIVLRLLADSIKEDRLTSGFSPSRLACRSSRLHVRLSKQMTTSVLEAGGHDDRTR